MFFFIQKLNVFFLQNLITLNMSCMKYWSTWWRHQYAPICGHVLRVMLHFVFAVTLVVIYFNIYRIIFVKALFCLMIYNETSFDKAWGCEMVRVCSVLLVVPSFTSLLKTWSCLLIHYLGCFWSICKQL